LIWLCFLLFLASFPPKSPPKNLRLDAMNGDAATSGQSSGTRLLLT
jgi:hypothetical protein